MKIGIVCYPTYGGSGVVATELGKALAKKGHKVFISEYQAPDDFECVFSMESVNTIGFAEETRKGKKKTHKSLEKLFIYAGNQSKC